MQKAKQSPLQGSRSQTKDPIEVPRLVHDLGSGLATPSLLCLKADSTLLPPVSDPRWPRPRPRAWKPERQLPDASQVMAEWDTGLCSREEGRASAPSKARALANEMGPDSELEAPHKPGVVPCPRCLASGKGKKGESQEWSVCLPRSPGARPASLSLFKENWGAPASSKISP